MARIHLQPLPEESFLRYRQESLCNYAAEQVRAGDWTEAEAPALALKAFESLLPLGLATEGHELMQIADADRDVAVGLLWFARRERAGVPIAYVYELEIYPEYRRQGLARATFAALESLAAGRGWRGVSLHVFGHNAPARALYGSLGYHDTHVTMFKALPG